MSKMPRADLCLELDGRHSPDSLLRKMENCNSRGDIMPRPRFQLNLVHMHLNHVHLDHIRTRSYNLDGVCLSSPAAHVSLFG